MIKYLIIDYNNINYLITHKIIYYNKYYQKLVILKDIQILKINIKEIKELICYYHKIRYLNISNLKDLNILNCDNNNLKYLNITNLINLKEISCNNNKLIELNLNNNILLEKLDCSQNQLQELYLNNNILLKELRCHNNKLKKINLNNNINLKNLDCFYNKLKTCAPEEAEILLLPYIAWLKNNKVYKNYTYSELLKLAFNTIVSYNI